MLTRMDEFGRPAWILATVLGFWMFWPVGLAILAYLAWTGRLKTLVKAGADGAMGRAGTPGQWFNLRADATAPAGPSGNKAFDDYRADTLRRLEEEQRGYRAVDKIWRQAWLAAEYGKGIPAREDAVLAAGPALLAEGGDFARGVRRYLAQSVDHRLHMTVEAPRRSCSRCSRGGDTRQGGAREHE